jgi:hypothetical protein
MKVETVCHTCQYYNQEDECLHYRHVSKVHGSDWCTDWSLTDNIELLFSE